MNIVSSLEKNNFDKVGDFLRKFGLPNLEDGRRPTMPPEKLFLFRFGHMMEELTEVLEAYRDKDMAKLADGLADLLYLVYGTAHTCRIPIDRVFDEVHAANMRKERSTGDDDPRGNRGSAYDIVKPAGWTGPDVEGVLEKWEATFDD